MEIHILAIFFISLASGYIVHDGNYRESASEVKLEWPKKYMVKATRYSLTSNFDEDITAWKTSSASRVDYNQGAEKLITLLDENEKYQIRPETKGQKLNEIVCIVHPDVIDKKDLILDEILPTFVDRKYVAVGNETVNDKFTVKFEFTEVPDEYEISAPMEEIYALWVHSIPYGFNDEYVSVPVRYEYKKFNSKLEKLEKHELWEFYNYNFDFECDVFSTHKYNCSDENTVQLTADSDKILKELVFIDPDNDKHVDHVFNKYKENHDRKYAHDKEHAMRKAIFRENMRMITTANRRHRGYTLALNHFSDRTPEEIRRVLGGIERPAEMKAPIAFPYTVTESDDYLDNLPEEYDARIEGLVGPVLDQGDCGSCWSFGARGAVEGAIARSNGGRLMSLSNQALIDCAWGYVGPGAGGCDGGFDYAAFEWIMKYGLPTDEEYGEYKNRNGYCHIANMTKTYKIRGYTEVTPFSIGAMKVALYNHGPVSVSMYVSNEFLHYANGIFYQTEKECRHDKASHVVIAVGYGKRYGDLYWILKNTWGPRWGLEGYMTIAAADHVCGVTRTPTYVVV